MGGSSSKLSAEQKAQLNVIVVGGGYGGIECAARLKKEGIPYKIIDPKLFFHHAIGALRASVSPDFCKKTTIPFKESFGDDFIQGVVVDVNFEEKKITLDSGDSLNFTHLVLATGSTGESPSRTQSKTVEEIQKEHEQYADEIKKSSKFVIVGGGAVGIELAGEIRDKYPEGEITILQSGEKLLSLAQLGERLQDDTKKMLERRNIKVQLGERVSNLSELTFIKHCPQTVVTEKGNSFESDIVFNCTGLRSDATLVKKILGPNQLEENTSRVKVDEHLLVVMDGENKNVFAIGDICNTKEEKMAAHAGSHAHLVVDNIILNTLGQNMQNYKPKFVGMIIPIGEGYGTGIYNGWHLPSFACVRFKSKTLFTEKFWATMGQKEPN